MKKIAHFISTILVYRAPGLQVLAIVCLLGIFGQACVPQKKLTYFQQAEGNTIDTAFNPIRQDYPLQAGDVLSVKLTGPDPAALAPFGTENAASSGQQVTNIQLFVTGYSISDSGTVKLPVIGPVYVQGLTMVAAQKKIQKEIEVYVKNALVNLRLVSFKISVLGEVRTPGTFYIYNERLTLLEALGYAADLTDLANREQIKLIRNRNGQVKIVNLDITKRQFLGSPYFFLQPNDVIYVEPISSKAARLNLPALSVVLAALTSVLVLVNIIVSARN